MIFYMISIFIDCSIRCWRGIDISIIHFQITSKQHVLLLCSCELCSAEFYVPHVIISHKPHPSGFLLFKKTAALHALLRGPITELAFSGSQASGLCAYPVLLFLHAAYYEPEVYTGIALSEIRSWKMCARKCGCVCAHTHMCMRRRMCVSAVLLLIPDWIYMVPKSAGWCNKGVYLCVCVWRRGWMGVCM